MLTEDDFEGYLFGHFIGEESDMGEQIYFAVSEDGLHFKDLNNKNPVLVSNAGEKGVRDPFLYRSHPSDPKGNRFFLIATDLSIYHRGGWVQNEQGYYDASTTGSPYLVLWESRDLVNWDEPKLIKAAPDNAGMAWAPEMIFCEETGEYVIFFASSIMNPETKHKIKENAIYYVTTKDFENFSSAKLFLDCQEGREIIDTTVLKVGDWYYSVSKDGHNGDEKGGILIMKTRNLLNPASWEKVMDLDDLNLDLTGQKCTTLTNTSLEGPELFQFNRKDWENPDVPEYGLIADQYIAGAGYLPLKTTDLEDKGNAKESWKILSSEEYSFDKLKKRHGTILRITRTELEALKAAYKTNC